jgi:hypothetical protein
MHEPCEEVCIIIRRNVYFWNGEMWATTKMGKRPKCGKAVKCGNGIFGALVPHVLVYLFRHILGNICS